MAKSRFLRNSCDKNGFKRTAPSFESALKDSGYSSATLNFVRDKPSANMKSHKRKILWFKPLFSSAVITNIGKEFFRLQQNHFPPHHRLCKIYNKSNVKLSYCCMPNINLTITGHNSKLRHTVDSSNRAAAERCNYRSSNNCSLMATAASALWYIKLP